MEGLLTAIITSSTSLIVAIVSIVMNNRIISYKVDELKKQVEKHNNIIERVYKLEEFTDNLKENVEDIKKDIERLEVK